MLCVCVLKKCRLRYIWLYMHCIGLFCYSCFSPLVSLFLFFFFILFLYNDKVVLDIDIISSVSVSSEYTLKYSESYYVHLCLHSVSLCSLFMALRLFISCIYMEIQIDLHSSVMHSVLFVAYLLFSFYTFAHTHTLAYTHTHTYTVISKLIYFIPRDESTGRPFFLGFIIKKSGLRHTFQRDRIYRPSSTGHEQGQKRGNREGSLTGVSLIRNWRQSIEYQKNCGSFSSALLGCFLFVCFSPMCVCMYIDSVYAM